MPRHISSGSESHVDIPVPSAFCLMIYGLRLDPRLLISPAPRFMPCFRLLCSSLFGFLPIIPSMQPSNLANAPLITGTRILPLRQLNHNLFQPTLASLASSPSFAPTPPLLAASLWHSSPAPAPLRYSPPSAPNCARRDGFWYILRAASSLQERWSPFPAFGNSSDAQNRDLKCVRGEYEACVRSRYNTVDYFLLPRNSSFGATGSLFVVSGKLSGTS